MAEIIFALNKPIETHLQISGLVYQFGWGLIDISVLFCIEYRVDGQGRVDVRAGLCSVQAVHGLGAVDWDHISIF